MTLYDNLVRRVELLDKLLEDVQEKRAINRLNYQNGVATLKRNIFFFKTATYCLPPASAPWLDFHDRSASRTWQACWGPMSVCWDLPLERNSCTNCRHCRTTHRCYHIPLGSPHLDCQSHGWQIYKIHFRIRRWISTECFKTHKILKHSKRYDWSYHRPPEPPTGGLRESRVCKRIK